MKNEENSHFTNKCFLNDSAKMTFIVLAVVAIVAGITRLRKTVTVTIDGNEKSIVTYKSKVKDVLSDNNILISQKDKISKNLESKIVDGDNIYIKKAMSVKINVDNKEIYLVTTEDNVKDMLEAENIEIDDDDKVTPSLDEPISDGMNVSVVRVETKLVKQTEPLEYSTVVKKDDNLLKGTRKIVQKGQNGEKQISLKVVYENGKEVLRKVVSESIIKQPVSQIIAVGNMGTITPSRGGSLNYSKVIRMTATAYTANEACTGKEPGDYGFAITASGTKVKRNVNGYSTIAVDPRVIPLGTKVYVEGYGLAIAEDTGGAIKGNKIDLYMDSYSDAVNWGVRSVNVYILK